jgi:hypothetical protein
VGSQHLDGSGIQRLSRRPVRWTVHEIDFGARVGNFVYRSFSSGRKTLLLRSYVGGRQRPGEHVLEPDGRDNSVAIMVDLEELDLFQASSTGVCGRAARLHI